MKSFKKVKIVATLGPASDSPEVIKHLMEEGVNVFRLNLSHRRGEEFVPIVKRIRDAEKKTGHQVAIMADLGGPKIRIGTVKPGVHLAPGDTIEVVHEQVEGDARRISLNYPSIIDNLAPGAEIYIGDGLLKFEVEKKTTHGVMARVIVGGELMPKKGFSAQGLVLDQFEFSEKDRQDIKALLKEGVDAFAVSFVQTAEDVKKVIHLLPKTHRPMVIAKIETLAGIHNIESILDVADGMMVARGDLGFAIPLQDLPHIQKNLISIALRHAKPVITATQMLESMMGSHLPTRAEVTDVANAILDGTDAVMLSGETAMGKYPVECVKMMSKIIRATENHVDHRHFAQLSDILTDAVSDSAVTIADKVGAKLLMVHTQSGATACRISRHRHHQPILALSPDERTVRRLCFSWGVSSMHIPVTRDFDHLIEEAKKNARKNAVHDVKKGEPYIISAGVPFGKPGTTNMIFVQKG